LNYLKRSFILLIFLFTIFSFGQTPQNYESWESQLETGLEFLDSNNYKEALVHLNEAYKISQNIFVKNEEELGYTAYYLASTYDVINNYEKAIPLYIDELNNLRLNKAENEPHFVETLLRVAVLYKLTGNYDNSIKTSLESLKIIEINQGKDSLEYSKALNNLSIVYKKTGDFNKAIGNNKLSNTIIANLYGEQSTIYAQNSISLSQIYIEIGQYDKAEIILDEVLPLLKSLDPKGNAYILAIFTKGVLHHSKYEYEKEILLYEEVKVISNKDDRAYISANNNLSVAFEEIGDYENALKIAIEVAGNTLETDHNYFIRLQNLAFIYAELGEFEEGLTTYEKAVTSCRNIFGTNHPLYAKLTDCIGQLYLHKGDFEQAKILFREALSVLLKSFDENHSEYGFYLNHYTSSLLGLNQNDEAIELMIKNIKISELNANTESQDYYRKKLGLAKAYNKIGNYNEALPILISYTEKIKQKLGDRHPDYGDMLKSLGDTYMGLEQVEKAIPVIDSFNTVLISQIDKVFKFRSEKQKKSFLKITNRNFDELQSIAYQLNTPNGRLNEINLDNQIMLKGLLLNNSKNLLSQLSTLNNTDINSEILIYRSVKTKLTRTLSLPFEERILDIDSLKNLVNTKESKLVKLYSTSFKQTMNLYQSWRQSQSKLDKNDVSIEFSYYQYSNKNKSTDSILYVAYIFKKDWEYPKMISLFEEKQLKSILSKQGPNQLYSSRGSKAKGASNTKAIFDLVWSPLEKYVTNSSNIYYAPSGLLNQISFAALGEKGKKTLSEKHNLFQLSTSGVLANIKITPVTNSALFIGGIDYDSLLSSNKNIIQDSFLKREGIKSSRSSGESWTYLPGTLKEVETLQTILESNGSHVDRWSGKEATETNFKKLSGKSPNILHVATHGFFYENLNKKPPSSFNLSTEDQYRLAEDPLLRSGLLLAGANQTWKNGHNKNQVDDGILTAMEIANMDLSNTDIVVLSACETGLGDIDGSEGVYGLQRAFKMAGVHIIIMSLWEVPDIETAEFMSLFYSNWMQSNKVKQAFNDAQRTMQTKYRTEPEKWAAFVLFE
jgi:CHAT domain-containing protein/tetratricopeptide (TPR) repeat protein